MRQLFLGVAFAALVTLAAEGHHSFAAVYHEDQTISIEGEVVAFEFRSPHAWLHVRVIASDEASKTYAAEWANPNRLTRDNITPETLKPGDVVRVSGSPSRKTGELRLHLKAIERPSDGWTWGNRGRR